MPSFHIIDRWVAIAKSLAFVAGSVYLMAKGKPPLSEEPNFVAFTIIAAILALSLEILQIVGTWRHKKWGFGLTAGLYVFRLLSGIFVTIFEQGRTVPLRPVSIVDWHDTYMFPIALYCAYRYITFHQREEQDFPAA